MMNLVTHAPFHLLGHHVGDLDRHYRNSHSKEVKFVCDLCGYGARMKYVLLHHIRSHFSNRNRKKFVCKICGYKTLSELYLSIHQKKHTNDPNELKCHCGKEFESMYHIAHHVRAVHQRNYKYQCTECPKVYAERNKLNDHVLRIHTKKDVRDIICDQCGMGFVTETQVKAHINNAHDKGELKF
jgi:KRAB domain-containing zinc finger protein